MTYINPFVSYYKRLSLFVLSIVFCFIVTTFLMALIFHIFGATPASLRISVILQNLISCVLPAIIVAVLISKNPVALWGIGKTPTIIQLLLTVIIMFVAIPAMNWIVAWNASIHLPDFMAPIEDWMRNLEDAAADTTLALLDNKNIYSLIITVLSVGVFTGFSEELLFRGTLQRIFQSRPMNIHLAIWITAIIFSIIHFQFFGFVPRMLLGAYFGYLFWWTKSLWAPILAHMINNSMVVINAYIYGAEEATNNELAVGVGANLCPDIYSLSSCIVSALLIYIFYRFYSTK